MWYIIKFTARAVHKVRRVEASMKTFDYVQERQVTIDKKAEIVYRRRGYSLCVSCRQAVLINKSHKSALKWQLTFMVTYPLPTTNYRLQTHICMHT